MKPNSHLLLALAAAVASTTLIAGVPDQTEKEKPPVVEKPDAARLALAKAAIQTGVLDIFNPPGTVNFGRSIPMTYTLNFTIAGPGDIAVTAAILPFEIQRGYGTRKTNFTNYLSGYYDARSSSVRLFDDKTKAYVDAAEHPFIKARGARIPVKPAPSQTRQTQTEQTQTRPAQ